MLTDLDQVLYNQLWLLWAYMHSGPIGTEDSFLSYDISSAFSIIVLICCDTYYNPKKLWEE